MYIILVHFYKKVNIILEIYKNFSIIKNKIYNIMFVFSYKNKEIVNNNKVIDKQI